MTPSENPVPPESQEGRTGTGYLVGFALPSPLRNWIGMAGLLCAAGGGFSFLLLFLLDLFAPYSNPYVGVVAYLIAPGIGLLGVVVMVIGALIQRRQLKEAAPGAPPPFLSIDTNRPRDRRRLVYFFFGSIVFLTLVSLGSYRSYHFMESVSFCGQACHVPMKPEFTTYQNSPHARVSCSECHIGEGAEWYVKAKISGMYQTYATTFDKFERPIATPIKNLRPAQETCEHCHWPKKFIGNTDRTYTRFLGDDKNTPYSVRLLLKVGGGDPTNGPVGGIHWHMNVGNKVEYVATDEKRETIPWVRMTDPQGVVTEFVTPDFKGPPDKGQIRRMDCMDCHNRPSHIFQSPNDAVDLALSVGRIDRKIPGIKREAVALLDASYSTETEALEKIATGLHDKYASDPRLKETISEVQRIFKQNFFPEMKANWKAYPTNTGHKEWPGCFRCHDGQHRTPDGKQSIKANDCTACHVILAQGTEAEMEKMTAKGEAFHHPGGDFGDMKCFECHGSAAK
ncbi:MAG: NapC/NirT family cytochrome c [Candidatus Sericytochromatia bacterium]|nr:NapC/NirT family cytochrome c [Candidatus Tanganyikabacteria bacterium]